MEHLDNTNDIVDIDNNTETSKPLPPATPKWTGLSVRIISGVVLASLALIVLCSGGFIFALLILLAAMQMLREWDKLTEEDDSIWGVAGLFYVAIPCAAILWLRNLQIEGFTNAGFWLVLYVLFVVWATDIGAYFTGRTIGGAKLAATISPGKTWAGLGGGIGAAGVVGGLSCLFTPYPTTLFGAINLAVLLAIISQCGDLFESWLKRRAGVKDSSKLIPGHGGLLDRVDGLMFTIPLFALLVYFSSLFK
ncbi:MAG: phosphatidate cytidylyltransferase [Rickettsiales bacterium]|jgi:phosphatidate cytidylyltransferase